MTHILIKSCKIEIWMSWRRPFKWYCFVPPSWNQYNWCPCLVLALSEQGNSTLILTCFFTCSIQYLSRLSCFSQLLYVWEPHCSIGLVLLHCRQDTQCLLLVGERALDCHQGVSVIVHTLLLPISDFHAIVRAHSRGSGRETRAVTGFSPTGSSCCSWARASWSCFG